MKWTNKKIKTALKQKHTHTQTGIQNEPYYSDMQQQFTTIELSREPTRSSLSHTHLF